MGNSEGANGVDGADDCMKERGELLRSVDEITRSIVGEIESSIISEEHENLSHRLEYIEKKQDALLSSKIQSLENEKESMKASMKVIEYLVYTKNDGSPDRTHGVVMENENPIPTNLHRDKGKQIDNDCTVKQRKKGVLIHEISSNEEHVGDEYNPDIMFTFSDAEEDNVIIDESLSTLKPQKMQETQFTAAKFGKGVRGLFKPRPEFDLTWVEMRMALYVFNKDLDPREVLVKIGDVFAKRRDLESLLPNNLIDEKIMTLVCRKLTWIQAGATTLVALDDTPYETIVEDHAKPWMPFSYPLKVIYVPLLEGDIHCKNSGVWLLDWLEMGDAFQTNIIGVLEEDKTRMQTAVKLVLGHYNEMKATTESKTCTTWMNLPI
ncbi:hypothetical protein RIF29_00568 [Crotalaria pallida]|uniref:Uncharacterized protein n=1 Tax=Crotalaria pallida TaxID=3830 RepID=A0AAN9P6K7_CROPI